MSNSSPARGGAVACELQLASDIGADILKRGGSAADALIAVCLVVGVVNSHHTGIGGGGFALIRTPEGKYESVDCRVAAPAAAHPNMHAPNAHSPIGPLSVAVPGELAGLARIHAKYGKLPWAACFKDAIRLARDGFPLGKDMYEAVQATIPGNGHHASTYPDPAHPDQSWIPTSELTFFGSSLPVIGQTIRRPDLAATLERIANEGVDVLYQGDIGRSIVDHVRKAGGVLSMEDMQNYQALAIEPLSIPYKAYRIYSTPAPSSGSIVLSALNTLSGYEDIASVNSARTLHRAAEALKFAFGQRTIIGDPAYVPEVPVLQRGFLRPESGERIRKRIRDDGILADEAYNPARLEIKVDNGTSHFCAADSSGLVISMTSTVLLYWGSRLMDPATGVILNNGMEDFSVAGRANTWGYEGTAANYIAGGKRPLSSQSPYIIEGPDGMLFAGGCAGGSRIISANVQVARNVLDYDMTAADALKTPRIHHQLQPNVLEMEKSDARKKFDGFSDAQCSALAEKGHQVVEVDPIWSNPCAVKYTAANGWEASGDPRKWESGGSVV